MDEKERKFKNKINKNEIIIGKLNSRKNKKEFINYNNINNFLFIPDKSGFFVFSI